SIIAATRLCQTLRQHLDWRALPELAAIHQHQVPHAFRRRAIGFQCHNPAPLQARRDIDRVAFLESHDGLLGIALPILPTAELLQPALADESDDRFHLDLHQLLDGRLDARLRRIPPDIEDDLVELRSRGRVLCHDRVYDHVIRIELFHLNRASSASTAAFVSTSLRRRRISYTLMPWTGSTSMFGMLRAARANRGSSSAPSMMSAFESSSFSKALRSEFVFPSVDSALSRTMSSPALALAERAWRRANARTFFGRSMAWLRGLGPNALPPPRHSGTLLSPCRALPVPFCR